jgi:hypothetical protein
MKIQRNAEDRERRKRMRERRRRKRLYQKIRAAAASTVVIHATDPTLRGRSFDLPPRGLFQVGPSMRLVNEAAARRAREANSER